jgi:hypothetical protein
MSARGVVLVWPVRRRFLLPSIETTYRPDFYAPEEGVYYEVVGTRQAYSANRHKYEAMAIDHPDIVLRFVRSDASPYVPMPEITGATDLAAFFGAAGRKGGKRRAERLTPERRQEIARQGAEKRWAEKRQGEARPPE